MRTTQPRQSRRNFRNARSRRSGASQSAHSARGGQSGRRSRRGGGQSRHRSHDQNQTQNRRGGFSRAPRRGARKMPTFDPTQFINTNPQETVVEVYVPKHTFSTLGFSKDVERNIAAANLTVPTPIQDQIIPEILDGNDVIGIAETGTGKTAAFLLPLIDITVREHNSQTLILTPTRELALQIESELRKMSCGLKIFSTVCVGGMGIGPQIRGLRLKNHFVIGTPGRVLDLIKRGVFQAERTTHVVLDEADRMLDMGFIHDMRTILSHTPSKRSTLLFSATMNEGTKTFANGFLRNPVTVSVKKKDVIDSIEQDVVRHTMENKLETLTKLFDDDSFSRVIIFAAMKFSAERLSKDLRALGIAAESIHGNKTHNARQRSLKAFQSGNARVLVATDVAARGIHVDNVSHVINYDLPNTFEDYVHRIGRTGRGAHRGKALTFVQA